MLENLYHKGNMFEPSNMENSIFFDNWTIKGNSNYYKKDSLRNNARWDCPPNEWMKVKFDGTSKENPGVASCGMVLRDENGVCNGLRDIPLGFQTNHVAETNAAFNGLILSKEKCCRKIWVEGDSLNIIKCLNKNSIPLWSIHNVMQRAHILNNSFEECVITHNFR